MTQRVHVSSHVLNKWARIQVEAHGLAPREAHVLKELVMRVDLTTLDCRLTHATLAQSCGYAVTKSKFMDRSRGEQREVKKCTAIHEALKVLHEKGLIRICQQGQRKPNQYYVNYSQEDVEASSKENVEASSRCTSTRVLPKEGLKVTETSSQNDEPQEGVGSTLTRTPENPPPRPPLEVVASPDDDRELSDEEIRALIESSPLMARHRGEAA